MLAGCSSAGTGGASAGETAAARQPATIAHPPRTSRPDTLPTSEPSRLDVPPIISPVSDTTSGDRATIARLERQARALVHTAGCATVSQCRTAPVGAKACGGPRTWLVYCAASTDTLRLMRALRALERVEQAANARAGIMSTCEMQLAPTPALAGGSCRADGAAP